MATKTDHQLEFDLRATKILEHPAALANPELARELCLRSTMSADAAIAILQKAPSAESPYTVAMNRMGAVLITSAGGPGAMTDRETRRAEIKENLKGFRAARGGGTA